MVERSLDKREELAWLGKRKAIWKEKTSSKYEGRRKKLTACPSCHLTHNIPGAGGRHHYIAFWGEGGHHNILEAGGRHLIVLGVVGKHHYILEAGERHHYNLVTVGRHHYILGEGGNDITIFWGQGEDIVG